MKNYPPLTIKSSVFSSLSPFRKQSFSNAFPKYLMSSTAGTNAETKDFQSFEIASRLYGCCLAGRLTLHNERGKKPKRSPKICNFN